MGFELELEEECPDLFVCEDDGEDEPDMECS